jgi:hypothetical protein
VRPVSRLVAQALRHELPQLLVHSPVCVLSRDFIPVQEVCPIGPDLLPDAVLESMISILPGKEGRGA